MDDHNWSINNGQTELILFLIYIDNRRKSIQIITEKNLSGGRYCTKQPPQKTWLYLCRTDYPDYLKYNYWLSLLGLWLLVTVLSRLLSISYYAQLFWELTAFSVNKKLYGTQTNSSELEFMGVIFQSSSPCQTSFLGGWLECYKITVTLFFPEFEINFQAMFLCCKW